MKLYNEHLPAPNPRRVRIFMAEKGIEMELVHVPMRERGHKSPEHRARNSLGQLPTLELDNGSFLNESVSICRYLEELYPRTPLFGSTPLERATIDMWNRRIELVLMAPIGAVWVHTHRYTAHLGTQYKDWGEANRERVAKAMQWLDQEIEGRDFIAGDRYSMADILALTTIDFATFIGVPMPDDCPRLKAWHERVSARPSAQA